MKTIPEHAFDPMDSEEESVGSKSLLQDFSTARQQAPDGE
jgi:hypothetical protein